MMSLPPHGSFYRRRSVLFAAGVFAFALLLTAGIFARNGWFPRTDALTGERTGWFGRKLPKNSPSSWDPFGVASPTPTPQLSKEYIYAGSRLLAVEDANANAVPPADLAVWRPSNGTFYVLGGPGSQQTSQGWGMAGDIPVPGDYDGDGKTDFAVVREGSTTNSPLIWYIIRSSDNVPIGVSFGDTGTDLNAQADYDGDGKTDIAIWRDTTGQFWYRSSIDNTFNVVAWGSPNDYPVASYDTH